MSRREDTPTEGGAEEESPAPSPSRTRLVVGLWVLGGLLRGLPFCFDILEPLVWIAPIPWMFALQLNTRRAFLWGWFGGFLYVGHSESLARISTGFQLVAPSVYRRS